MKVLLTTLHSRYIHSSLALPCLASFCQNLEGVEILVREFTVNEEREKVFSQIAGLEADLIAFSCYIWNIDAILELAHELKKENKGMIIVLGGPEVSFDGPMILREKRAIDFIVKGEGEQSFSLLLQALRKGMPVSNIPGTDARDKEGRIISTPPALLSTLDNIPSPFRGGLVHMSKPLIYYESSRGCPFTCAFCLSSIEERVRSFSMERIKSDLFWLMEQRASTIKFVDRTFNYHPQRANEIWQFILHKTETSKYHFEIAADLLTDSNLEVLQKVPPHIFRFEIGIQSIAEETLHSVGRKSDLDKLFSNVRRLITETQIDIHLDLVAGLPGEDFEGFLASLERLFSLKGHHIQVEPLKVLKGAPMMDIAEKEGYRWSLKPPYRIRETPWLRGDEIDKIEIMGYLLERVYNSGRFCEALNFLGTQIPLSRFFSKLADSWVERVGETISLDNLFEAIAQFGASLLKKEQLPDFYDALTFDRAMAGYPLEKGLPFYFQENKEIPWNVGRKEIVQIRKALKISSLPMVKAFRWKFKKNHYDTCGVEKSPLLFIYLSEKGKKQKVIIKNDSSLFFSTTSL